MTTPRGRGVLQVVLSLSPGGTERLVVDVVSRLRDRYRMAVCCLDEPGAWAPDLERQGIEVISIGRRPGFHPAVGRRIATMAARLQLNVLHCHQYTPFVYGALARVRHPHLRVLFTEHGRTGDDPPSRKRRVANTLLARLPSRVCAVSADLARHLTREGFPPSRVQVVPNGIDPGARPDPETGQRARLALGLDDQAFVIGTVGRLNAVKDLPTLFDAFERLLQGRPDATLVVVGDGPERAALERRAAAAGDRIRFTGHRGDVRALMAAFDVYVSSSVFEGVSLTILEAMAAGRPVVATRVGGTPEVVADGQTGLLVPPRDPLRLAEALLDLSASPQRARALGAAGRLRVCDRFTFDRMVDWYAAAYGELGAS